MTELSKRPYWYLRHGETDWNVQGLSQGKTDIPLNERGVTQAKHAGKVLGTHMSQYSAITHIVASPLIRARRTAEIAAEFIAKAGGPNLTISVDKDLEEVNFGEREGKPMGNWYDSWIEGEYTPPAGEPFEILKNRGVAAINRATEEGIPLIVCHGAMFRAIRAAMALPPNVRLANATPLWISPSGQKKEWMIEALTPEPV